MKRKKLSRDEFQAVAILHVRRGNGQPVISREEAASMTPAEIVATFKKRIEVEHIVPFAITKNNHPSNLQFMAPDEHAPKTKVDVREIAKTKRVEKKQAEFKRKLLAKSGAHSVEEPSSKPRSKLKSRGFQKVPEGHKFNWGRKA